MYKIGVLSSTRGSNLPAVHAATRDGTLTDTEISVVLTNTPRAGVIEKAENLNIPLVIVEPAKLSREEYDKLLITFLESYEVDLIILNGWMRILSPVFIRHFAGRVINIHPSLLPKFAGGMDKNVHQAVLDAGETETGCTLHFATEEPDAGPIIVQRRVKVTPTDTPATLKEKVQAEEQKALVEGIKLVKSGQKKMV